MQEAPDLLIWLGMLSLYIHRHQKWRFALSSLHLNATCKNTEYRIKECSNVQTPLTEVAAFAFLFMMCSSIALADSRACSDPQVKEALALKAQNSRNSYVDMLNRQGRSVWAKVSGIHEVETLSSNKESRRKNASPRHPWSPTWACWRSLCG